MPETTLCRRLYRCQCAWEEMPGSPRLAVSPREQQVPRPSYTSLSDERHILNFSTIIKLKLWNFYYNYILYGHAGTTILIHSAGARVCRCRVQGLSVFRAGYAKRRRAAPLFAHFAGSSKGRSQTYGLLERAPRVAGPRTRTYTFPFLARPTLRM